MIKNGYVEPLIAKLEQCPPLQQAHIERLRVRVKSCNAQLRAMLSQLKHVANKGGENSGKL